MGSRWVGDNSVRVACRICYNPAAMMNKSVGYCVLLTVSVMIGCASVSEPEITPVASGLAADLAIGPTACDDGSIDRGRRGSRRARSGSTGRGTDGGKDGEHPHRQPLGSPIA